MNFDHFLRFELPHGDNDFVRVRPVAEGAEVDAVQGRVVGKRIRGRRSKPATDGRPRPRPTNFDRGDRPDLGRG
jgi:hypothetical protein